ncbi:hypothetical protein GCM10012275_01770 [Longimycelium tulufanense]|uniref:S-adenosyl methyltransferase n=1 Tax=Longimycelium tulufanense TaxID=907463 RepID=A0A8J3FSC5_9PSEU|nr:SAM-dependent methyltransferase [Longimycelium tulufanense]GGM34000.1 hypothetical protein GCM10012275_01770 [Longimycelium tulufanense]
MTEKPNWVPTGLDTSVANPARVYDYLLGGGHNFEADRKLAHRIERELLPHARDLVRLSRGFLRRALLFMIENGVRQFLDLGSGIPTVGNVHQIAQQADPRCRVVYVDHEPIAVAHSELMLQGNDRAAAVLGDLLDPEDILGRPEVRRLLDLDQPVGLLTLMVWHFIPDSAKPGEVLRRYRQVLAPGSCLAISHLTNDQGDESLRRTITEYHAETNQNAYARSHAEIVAMFDGFELVEPGVVGCAAWRPQGVGDFSDDPTTNLLVYGGVGRKPRVPAPPRTPRWRRLLRRRR